MKKLFCAVGLLVLLAACGGGDPRSPEKTPAEGGSSPLVSPGVAQSTSPDAAGSCEDNSGDPFIFVLESDNVFSPDCVRGKSSQGIQIRNGGKNQHNFSVEGTSIDLDTAPGQTTNTEAANLDAGDYVFFCKFHRDQGMTGKLVVV